MLLVKRPVGGSLPLLAENRNHDSIESPRPAAWLRSSLWMFVLLTLASTLSAQMPPVKFLGTPSPQFTSGLSFPIGLAGDSSGNVYIAEYSASFVYKETLQPNGTYVRSTVATGFPFGPVGLAIDSAGNVYIGLDFASTNSSLLKETLQSNGSYVQSYIGTGLEDVYGIAVDSSGNVYATNTSGAENVYKFTPSGNTYTSNVIFTSPSGVLAGLALDSSGNLFVTKEYGSTIYKLTPTGNPATATVYTSSTITTTVSSAFDVAVDTSGDLYVADTSGYLRLETPNGSGGYAEAVLASGLGSSYGATIAPTGVIYFSAGGQVDVFSPAAVNFGTHAVSTTTSATGLNYTVQPGTVVSAINVVSQGAANTQNGLPEFVKTGGNCTVQTYSSLTTCSVNVTFTARYPGLRTGAVEFLDGSGNVLSTANLYGIGTDPVAAFSAGATSLLSVSGLGATPLNGAGGPVFDAAGNLYLADTQNNRIVKVTPGGAASVINTGGLTLSAPGGVAIDGAGTLYIADTGNGRVVKVTIQGVAGVMNTNSIALAANSSVAVDGLGDVSTTDATHNRVLVFPNIGTAYILTTTGVTLNSPSGVAADGNGNVFIADKSNSRIVKVYGGTGTVLSTGSLSPALLNPEAVAVDAVGNVYVSDTGNNRMVEISAGTTNGVAIGTGSYSLSLPNGAAVDNSGNLYIVDGGNNRIVISQQRAPAAFTFAAPGVTDSVTMLNLGNTPLTFAVPGSGHNPGFGTANFSLVNAGNAGYCPQLSPSSASAALAAGANCLLSVEYSPAGQTAGSGTDVLTITDNTLAVAASTQTISLSGTTKHTPSVALTLSPPSPIVYGQAATSLAASVTYTAGVPTGSISFYDNSASLGSPATLTAGAGTLAAEYYLPGTHSFQADYGGDTNFNSANSATAAYVVNKAASTIGAPSIAVQVAAGNAASVPITIAQQYSGAGIASATGVVSYSIVNSSTTVVASGTAPLSSGGASIPIANTLSTGTYTVTLGYAGDSNYTAAAAATATLHVGAATPTVVLTSSLNPAIVTNTVTFTASVASSFGTPTGTVNFLDGTTVLAAKTLSGGAATFTTSSLAAGTHVITAVYAGDVNFGSATSSAVSEVVQDFSLSSSGSTGASTPTQTVSPGGSAAYSLLLGPTTGATFPNPVTLSVSGLPPGATATITPNTLPAGSPLTNVHLTIQLPQTTAKLLDHSIPPVLWGILLLPFAARFRRAGKRLRGTLPVLLLALTMLAAGVGLSGCSSTASGFFDHPQTTYSVVITATSGSISHSTTVALIVR